MHTIGFIIGLLIVMGSGLWMFNVWLMAMTEWLGSLGSLLAFICAPCTAIFPFAFWIIEGVFPVSYFIVWGMGIAGMIIGGISFNKHSNR